jgi:hypothetical protein
MKITWGTEGLENCQEHIIGNWKLFSNPYITLKLCVLLLFYSLFNISTGNFMVFIKIFIEWGYVQVLLKYSRTFSLLQLPVNCQLVSSTFVSIYTIIYREAKERFTWLILYFKVLQVCLHWLSTHNFIDNVNPFLKFKVLHLIYNELLISV